MSEKFLKTSVNGFDIKLEYPSYDNKVYFTISPSKMAPAPIDEYGDNEIRMSFEWIEELRARLRRWSWRYVEDNPYPGYEVTDLDRLLAIKEFFDETGITCIDFIAFSVGFMDTDIIYSVELKGGRVHIYSDRAFIGSLSPDGVLFSQLCDFATMVRKTDDWNPMSIRLLRDIRSRISLKIINLDEEGY